MGHVIRVPASSTKQFTRAMMSSFHTVDDGTSRSMHDCQKWLSLEERGGEHFSRGSGLGTGGFHFSRGIIWTMGWEKMSQFWHARTLWGIAYSVIIVGRLDGPSSDTGASQLGASRSRDAKQLY